VDGYADPGEVIDRFPGLAGESESTVVAALVAARQWIDRQCSRSFSLAPATSRRFRVRDVYVLQLDRHEIGDDVGVVVKTDDGSGTFTTTLAASGYQLEPVDALLVDRPFTMIRRLGGMWPYATTGNSRQERVQVTAPWGWPRVPHNVKEASLILVNDELTNPAAVESESYDDYRVVYGAEAKYKACRLLARLQRPLVA